MFRMQSIQWMQNLGKFTVTTAGRTDGAGGHESEINDDGTLPLGLGARPT